MAGGGQTVLEFAREILGDAYTDDEVMAVVYEHTGFPSFWDCRGSETPQDVFRRQLQEYAAPGTEAP
jgi:hypothetical protein